MTLFVAIGALWEAFQKNIHSTDSTSLSLIELFFSENIVFLGNVKGSLKIPYNISFKLSIHMTNFDAIRAWWGASEKNVFQN